jgi:hypothetical protein
MAELCGMRGGAGMGAASRAAGAKRAGLRSAVLPTAAGWGHTDQVGDAGLNQRRFRGAAMAASLRCPHRCAARTRSVFA